MAITGDVNLGTILANLVVIGGPIWYFGNRWVKARETVEDNLWKKHDKEIEKREQEGKDIRKELATETAKIACDLEQKHTLSASAIIDKITSNKEIYTQSYQEISSQIKEMDKRLVDRMDVANGRTGKLEIAVGKVSTTCEERSKVFYKEAEKSGKKKK
jgi:hypothetical protein